MSSLDGKTYTKGSILPAWAAIGEKLNINFVDRATSSDANTNAQWTRLQTENFAGVDLVNAHRLANRPPKASRATSSTSANILDYMPYLKAFLEANPSVKVSMTSAERRHLLHAVLRRI
ncbi:MAG: hypothetical protein MZU97_26490 [Bacillus subtilis]|nr:hypothetical protein [Bacillus subtilis]